MGETTYGPTYAVNIQAYDDVNANFMEIQC